MRILYKTPYLESRQNVRYSVSNMLRPHQLIDNLFCKICSSNAEKTKHLKISQTYNDWMFFLFGCRIGFCPNNFSVLTFEEIGRSKGRPGRVPSPKIWSPPKVTSK